VKSFKVFIKKRPAFKKSICFKAFAFESPVLKIVKLQSSKSPEKLKYQDIIVSYLL